MIYFFIIKNAINKVLPHRGRQRKAWGRVVDELFVSLGLDRQEWVEYIKRGESLLASFLACIKESISEREGRQFEEGD